ncbi:MAG: TrkH family potassium uptake protein [Lachnospiraceae bacterium]|nr:TrkH family potassium uptake protein [Lachnospiraceae bacterium]MDD3796488.1 TrkH family potassium uptake protein [Lachnospiraceae bacterium]
MSGEKAVLLEYLKKTPEEKKKKKINSLQIMAPGFLGVILLGGLLLTFPVFNTDGKWLNFIDALFTSCSAVCVTGLVTIVPAVQFTLAGKILLLLLIQIGGMGVIVCVMWFMVLIKRKITLNARVIIQEYFNMDTMSGLVRMLLYVAKGTLVVEGCGAVLYSFYFIPSYGILRGIWYSVFHAISAFCNAGIDILGEDSFARFVSNPWMNLVTILLIVMGGLGFMVWKDLTLFLKRIFLQKDPLGRSVKRLTLQTKIVVIMTVSLIVFGMLFFLAAEYHNPETLGPLNAGEKWLAALFQSVTTRTAGFYTISQGGLRDASKFVSCILMFIGGSPVGTAGGIKTVTLAVLLLTCWSILKGHEDTECFRRKIANSILRSAVVVFGVGLFLLLAGTTALSLLEPGASLLDCMYEVASAVATVGLTAGLTPGLKAASKLVIIVLMYMGRIGPITLPMILAARLGRKNDNRTLPQEHIVVG